MIRLPRIVPPRTQTPSGALVGPWTGDLHIWLSYALLVAAGLHVLGAIYHRFVLRDRVLSRMLPGA